MTLFFFYYKLISESRFKLGHKNLKKKKKHSDYLQVSSPEKYLSVGSSEGQRLPPSRLILVSKSKPSQSGKLFNHKMQAVLLGPKVLRRS